jgi:hypothetical protein
MPGGKSPAFLLKRNHSFRCRTDREEKIIDGFHQETGISACFKKRISRIRIKGGDNESIRMKRHPAAQEVESARLIVRKAMKKTIKAANRAFARSQIPKIC